ncbi:NTP transferase domain-containing protein [Bacillus sp. PS06]|uniref:nucleotidyltransferase family protein n=1 Tax=Bacillus sp. PS06 TaxID=2764176 RepID=UPI0017840B31|nr:nucleotidyltransferase family protein [Bacillus sp. PS06]MBD8068005.1 NTP transferase domain-containing protein [Bacillus sp. PS06]
MNTNIVGIYLAAGKSSRMGSNKLTLPFNFDSLGSFALYTILTSSINTTIIVKKREDNLSWLNPIFYQDYLVAKWTYVSSPNAEYGQSYSLKAGLAEASKLKPHAYMIFLADQPFVSPLLIQSLLDEYTALINSPHLHFDYIAASIEGVIKPPIIFLNHTLPILQTMTGDKGARQLINKGKLKGKVIQFKDERMFHDIDTKEDYEIAITYLTYLNCKEG